MSRIVSLLVAVSIGLGVAVVLQNRELSAERLRVSALNESVAKIEAKALELEKEAARLRQLNDAFKSDAERLRSKLAGQPGGGNSPRAGEGGKNGVEGSEQNEKKEKGGFMQTMAKMYSDPEMRKAMRGQQAMGIRMMYGDLAKELGLSPQEASQVIEILTDRQLAMASKSMELMNGGAKNEAKMAELGQAMNESRKEYDVQIEDYLGKDRYAQLQDYEKTLGERMALNQIQQQFTSQGMALEETQQQQLLQAMIDERSKVPPTPWDPGKPDVAAQMRAMSSDEAMRRLFDQQKQINERVLNRAQAFLSQDQIDALQRSQEQFLQMQQMGVKMGKEMMGIGK